MASLTRLTGVRLRGSATLTRREWELAYGMYTALRAFLLSNVMFWTGLPAGGTAPAFVPRASALSITGLDLDRRPIRLGSSISIPGPSFCLAPSLKLEAAPLSRSGPLCTGAARSRPGLSGQALRAPGNAAGHWQVRVRVRRAGQTSSEGAQSRGLSRTTIPVAKRNVRVPP